MVFDHPRSENKVTMTFERTATQDLFNSKKRTITIHWCNLELDYKKSIYHAKYIKDPK